MHPLDWIIIGGYLVWVVYDGLKRARGTDKVEGYFLAGRSLPWWAVGLSVMATQMSAITLVGTTGQGYAGGLGLVQMYFGLPLAMIILSVTLVPFLYRARVFTAYEYLERRFDRKTRALTSLIFPRLAGAGGGGDHLRAGGRPFGGARLEPDPHGPRHRGSDDPATRCSAGCRPSRGPTSSRWSSSWAACSPWSRPSSWGCRAGSASATPCIWPARPGG